MIAPHEEPSFAACVDTLALALVPGIGPILQRRLVDHFGTAGHVLAASLTQLCAVEGVGRELAARIGAARDREAARQEWEYCQTAQIQLVHHDSPRYPPLLREIPDPPQLLYQRGGWLSDDPLCVAVVGTRHPTPYGRQQARTLAAALSRAGFTVVSGLARGIDAEAHRGALEAQGKTIAVLASGVQTIYPPEHGPLAEEIVAQGTLVSEVGSAGEPRRGAFPRRNRIITGLSLGVVVVEASLRSGALISARHALEQGREVMVLPGRVDSEASQGCHALIRDGATLIVNAEQVVESLGPFSMPVRMPSGRALHSPAELQLNGQETQVLDAIVPGGSLIDEVVRSTGLPTGRVLSTLHALEIRHLIRREGGARVVRTLS